MRRELLSRIGEGCLWVCEWGLRALSLVVDAWTDV